MQDIGNPFDLPITLLSMGYSKSEILQFDTSRYGNKAAEGILYDLVKNYGVFKNTLPNFSANNAPFYTQLMNLIFRNIRYSEFQPIPVVPKNDMDQLFVDISKLCQAHGIRVPEQNINGSETRLVNMKLTEVPEAVVYTCASYNDKKEYYVRKQSGKQERVVRGTEPKYTNRSKNMLISRVTTGFTTTVKLE